MTGAGTSHARRPCAVADRCARVNFQQVLAQLGRECRGTPQSILVRDLWNSLGQRLRAHTRVSVTQSNEAAHAVVSHGHCGVGN